MFLFFIFIFYWLYMFEITFWFSQSKTEVWHLLTSKDSVKSHRVIIYKTTTRFIFPSCTWWKKWAQRAETNTAFVHRFPCVCISKAAVVSVHFLFFFIPHLIKVQIWGHVHKALPLTLQLSTREPRLLLLQPVTCFPMVVGTVHVIKHCYLHELGLKTSDNINMFEFIGMSRWKKGRLKTARTEFYDHQ